MQMVGSESVVTFTLNLSTRWKQMLRPLYPPRKEPPPPPGTNCTEGYVGPTAGLDALINMSCLYWESNSDY
jgi:hypothetical protein